MGRVNGTGLPVDYFGYSFISFIVREILFTLSLPVRSKSLQFWSIGVAETSVILM